MRINKGKKKILAAGLVLLFLAVTGLSLLNNPPMSIIGLPTNNNYGQIQALAKLQGSGGSLNALLEVVNNTDNPNTLTDTNTGFNLTCPIGWNITQAQINITSINAPNHTLNVETDIRDDSILLTAEPAMSFTLSNDAYLDGVSLRMSISTAGSFMFKVWNASSSGKPDVVLDYTILNLPQNIPYYWQDVSFAHPKLALNNTDSSKFFISVDTIAPSAGDWGGVLDSTDGDDEGDVYYGEGTWNSKASDLIMKVNVSASESADYETPLPSEINLEINGTPVNNIDTQKGDGNWTLSTSTGASVTGNITFVVSSTWMEVVSLTIEYSNTTYGKYQTATTTYDVNNGTNALWNITIAANFEGGVADSFNLTSIDFPRADWENTTDYAIKEGDGTAPYEASTEHDLQFRADNGNWIVQCSAPNYVSTYFIKLQGFSANLTSAIPGDVLEVNVVYNSTLSGTSNLTVYLNSAINFTDEVSVSGSNIFTWNTSDSNSGVDTYNLTVNFVSPYEVGYAESDFPLINNLATVLYWLESPPLQSENGSIALKVQYNRTDVNNGVGGASITVWDNGIQIPSGQVNVFNHNNGTYDVNFTLANGEHNIIIDVKGENMNNYSRSFNVAVGQIAPVTGNFMIYVFLAYLAGRQGGTFPFLVLLILAVVAAGGIGTRTAYKRRMVPSKALASLENIIVDHIQSGATLWAFDFFKMEQDVTLVSGFMSAVKTFMGEMQKGGLRKLETEFGTFIREDGEFLTATCITCGNTSSEESWIRQRLRSFLSISEQQHLDALQKWKGDAVPFRKSFPTILASVINLDKTEELQRQRISKLENDKERLRAELNNLGSQMESLSKQVEAKEISRAEFEARNARIEPEYDRVQNEFVRVSLLLSRAPSKLEAKKVKPEVTEDMEKIQGRFLEIRMEIEELRRKEQEGTITSKDHKRRDKLQTELVSLIEKLDKLQK